MKYEELKTSILADAVPVRRLASPTRQFCRLAAVCLAAVLLYVAVSGLRFDFGIMLSSARYWMELLILLFIAAAAGLSALRLSVPGVTDGKREAGVILFALLLWPAFLLLKPDYSETLLEGHGWNCSAVVLLFSAAFVPVIYGMILRAAPVSPLLTGFAATLFCSTAGGIALHFVCPGSSFDHLFFWHFLPAAALPLVFIGAYRKIFCLR